MNHALWLACLFGIALLNPGHCRPNNDDYPQDGDGDYEENEDDLDDPVGPMPMIKSTPQTLNQKVGDVVFLPCEVEGNPDLFSRIWRKDNKGLYLGSVSQANDPRISLLPNGTLEIRQIEHTDSGTYSCMISHISLRAEDKPQEVIHTLRVRSPAKITKISPNERTVTLKQFNSLNLECIATGYPTPSIKWFKNEHLLQDTTIINGARYTIDNASLEDAGTYKCTATNGDQQMPDERLVEVQVHYPPEIKIARDTVPTGEGYESELKCTVTGLKKPELKWYKDQKRVTPSNRIKIERFEHDHILRIMKTQRGDFGNYVCEAKNEEGQASAVIALTGSPSRPVVQTVMTDGETKNPVLLFRVESFAPIEEYELLYKREEKEEWISEKPAISPSIEERYYTVKHIFSNLEPGVYIAKMKAKNNYGWSEFSSVQTFPKEHDGDLTETGLLAIAGETSSSAELRISMALLVSLLVAHFYC